MKLTTRQIKTLIQEELYRTLLENVTDQELENLMSLSGMERKKEYRRLARKYHPDNPGVDNIQDMQKVNSAYKGEYVSGTSSTPSSAQEQPFSPADIPKANYDLLYNILEKINKGQGIRSSQATIQRGIVIDNRELAMLNQIFNNYQFERLRNHASRGVYERPLKNSIKILVADKFPLTTGGAAKEIEALKMFIENILEAVGHKKSETQKTSQTQEPKYKSSQRQSSRAEDEELLKSLRSGPFASMFR